MDLTTIGETLGETLDLRPGYSRRRKKCPNSDPHTKPNGIATPAPAQNTSTDPSPHRTFRRLAGFPVKRHLDRMAHSKYCIYHLWGSPLPKLLPGLWHVTPAITCGSCPMHARNITSTSRRAVSAGLGLGYSGVNLLVLGVNSRSSTSSSIPGAGECSQSPCTACKSSQLWLTPITALNSSSPSHVCAPHLGHGSYKYGTGRSFNEQQNTLNSLLLCLSQLPKKQSSSRPTAVLCSTRTLLCLSLRLTSC